MHMRRREFLGSTLAGATGILLGQGVLGAEAEKSTPDLVPLGKTLKVTRIGAGTGMNGGNRQSNHTRMGKEKLHALLAHEYDLGVRLFDCADLYGTHPFVGEFLKGKPRDSFHVVSKLWFLRGGVPEEERPDADVSCKRFLKELQMDHIDILQIHCQTNPKWNEEFRKQMDIMEKLKEQGLIRAHGVTIHSLEALETAANEPWVDVIHVRINPFGHRTDGPMDKVLPILKKAKENGKGILGMKILGEGSFTPEKRAESVKFVMGTGLVDCLVVGFEKPEQVDEFKKLVAANLPAGK